MPRPTNNVLTFSAGEGKQLTAFARSAVEASALRQSDS